MHRTIAFTLAALLAPLTLSAQTREDVARAFYAALDDTSGPMEALTDLIANDYIDHDRSAALPVEVSDRDGFVGFLGELRRGFPDGTHQLNMVEPLSADRVMVHWSYDAVQQGSFLGIAASGNRVAIDGVDIMRITDGQIAEMWHVEELMAMFAQIAGEP